jgi:V-type H+-transporting ATPase subunit H
VSTGSQSGPDLAQALLNVLRNVSHQDTADYVLALIVEMLAEDKACAAHFHRAPGANEGDAYADLFRVLAKPHWFAQEKALFALARLVEGRLVKDLGLSAVAAACGGDTVTVTTAAPMGVAAQTIVQLVQWCCAQLRSPSHPRRAVPSAVSALAALLGVRDVRPLVTHSGGVELLAPLLFASSVRSSTLQMASSAQEERGSSHSPGPRRDVQLLYETSLCLWFLTFHPPALAAMRRGAFAEGLMDVAKRATKEKVARVAVLALRNIAEGAPPREKPERLGDASLGDVHASRRGSGGAAGPGPRTASDLFETFRGVDERALATLVQNLRGRGFADEELTGALGDLERGASARARATRVLGTRTSPSCAAAFWFGPRRTATRVSGANTRRG